MRPLLCFALLFSAAACDVDEGGGDDADAGPEDAVSEACEHMTDGPAKTGTVVPTNGDDPVAVNADHQRIDLTLFPEGEGNFSGAVLFEAAEASTYAFYVSTDLTFEVRTSGNRDVPIQETNAVDCEAIATEYVVDLAVGSYFLIFSRATTAKTALVHEDVGG